MKLYRLALAAGALLLWCASAQAACTLSHQPPASPLSKSTRLDTMTNDAVNITGGCVDGVTLGGNSAVTFTLPDAAKSLSVMPSVTHYGAKGDVTWATCDVTVSGTALSCPSAGWTNADVGKHIEIPSAGTVSNTAGATAIALTDAGTGYTSTPTCAVSGAPGSGATCHANMKLLSAAVNTGGTCTGGDANYTLNLTTGTGNQAQVTATVAGGTVTAIAAVLYAGSYTVLPAATTNQAVIGGLCTGTTLDLTFGVDSISVDDAGNDYPSGGSTTASLTGGGAGTPATVGGVTVADVAATHATTIASVTNSSNAVLAVAAPHSLSASSQLVVWGTDSSQGFADALAASDTVWVPSPGQDNKSPTGVYFVKDITLATGKALLGSASHGYITFPFESGTEVRPYLLAMQGATNVINTAGATDARIDGIVIDGHRTGADCISSTDTGARLSLTLVTAQRCNYGFGTSGKFSHGTRIVNSVFTDNVIGIGPMVDSKIFGGNVTWNSSDGRYDASGAGGNLSNGVRYEWNGGYGWNCDGCVWSNSVGDSFDANSRAGVILANSCSDIGIIGPIITRNARNNKASIGDRSDIVLGPICDNVNIIPAAVKLGRDDAGNGSRTPQYFVEKATGYMNNLTIGPGANGVVGIGVTVAGSLFNTTDPTNMIMKGNPGIQDVANTSFPASLRMQGDITSSAWTTNGTRLRSDAATLTDTSSSGTVATAYTSKLGADTVAASSATTYTNYYGLYIKAPVAGTNVTMTNKYAFGADSIDSPSYHGTTYKAINTGVFRILDNTGADTSSTYLTNDSSNNGVIGVGGAAKLRIAPTNGLIAIGPAAALTSSFPGLIRSGTTLQAVLADNSAFAPLQGKLTTNTNYTAGTTVATGYLTLYDATGTAYKVNACTGC